MHFYPPTTIIRRAQKIGLTPDQMTKIRQDLLGTQARAIDLFAKVEHAHLEITRLLSADKVDERAIDGQIDEAAKAMGEMHKLHLGMMLRVNALLTPDERQKLEERKPAPEAPKPTASVAGQARGALGEADDDGDDAGADG